MSENEKSTPDVEDQEWVKIPKEVLYCLTQHVGEFHQQAHEEISADFGEPCRKCKLLNMCNAKWERILEYFEAGQISLGYPAIAEAEDICHIDL